MEEILLNELAEIKRNTLLAAKNVLTLDDVVLLTGLSKNHLYNLTSRNEIPYYRPRGKFIYFDRAEVEAWMKQNRVNTREEAESQAAAYCAGKGGGRMNQPNNPNRLTRQEQRLYEMLKLGGRYTVADITRELGQCDPRGHISRMRRKGIGIADKRVTRPDGVNYKLYWLAE